jgi:hypothetical protein
MNVSQKLLRSLEDRWPWVVAEWNGFLTDFDFGYDAGRSLPLLENADWKYLDAKESTVCEVSSLRGWQSTGIRLRAGESLQLSADGSCQVGVGANDKPWNSQAQGITIRYFRHQPIGRLMASIVPIPKDESTTLWQPIAIGRDATLKSESEGLLLLKINEAAGDLAGNQGSLRVVLERADP